MATFGRTANGTGTTQSTIDRKKVMAAMPPSSGTVASISIRGARNTGGNAVIKGVIYADNAGSPGARLAVSDEITVDSATEQEWVGAFSGENLISVVGGTTYHIGWIQQSPGFVISRSSTNDSPSRTNSDTYADGPSNPFGAATDESGPVDVYVTYTEAGGGGAGTAPVVRSAASDAEGNTPTVTVTKPAGLAVGDYLLAFQESDADGGLAVMSAPGGFVELSTQAPTPGTNIPAGKVWGKVADAADAAAASFAFPDNTGSNSTVVLLAIQAGTYDPVTPVSTPVWATQGDAANANITAPSITGAAGGLLLTAHMPDTGGTTRSFSSGPAGMTLTHQSVAGGSTYTRIAVYQQALDSAAATGTKTAVLSASPTGWIATAMVVNPAPAAAGGVAQRTGGFLPILLG